MPVDDIGAAHLGFGTGKLRGAGGRDMIEDAEITLSKVLRAIARLTDAELLQLKAAARKEAEKRGLKPSRHSNAAETRRQ